MDTEKCLKICGAKFNYVMTCFQCLMKCFLQKKKHTSLLEVRWKGVLQAEFCWNE